MLKNLSISQKLIGGFLAVAIIAGIIGLTGWFGVSSVSKDVNSLGRNSIPSLIYLSKINQAQIEIQMGIRTLANPLIDQEDSDKILEEITRIRGDYAKSYEGYEKVSRTPEEEKLFETFTNLFFFSRTVNNDVVKLAKETKRANASQARLREIYLAALSPEHTKAYDNSMAALDKLVKYVNSYYGEEMVQKSERNSLSTTLVILSISLIGFVFALTLGIFIARSISRPVTKMTDNLYTSANSLEGAAGQVSSSSQELSSGASELASSVEEMTSSLEELQSIIEANTKNINEAELLMTETNAGAKSSTMKMDDMQAAMVDINDNSKKIVKIIKVIDDIAFQTNILALNAAVEAARAGDAGRGFAVVAEQVKNLAQKSAEAAKETADLIDRAIDSVAKGEQRGGEVKEVLNKAVDLAGKVGVLLDEINRASKEQLKGANQVTKAVTQINTVVQGTAASSEETASAGEEMLSQSEMLKTVVNNLNSLIKGGKAAQKSNPQIKSPLVHTESPRLSKGKQAEKPSHEPSKPLLSNEEIEIVKPEDKIPLQDFKDF